MQTKRSEAELDALVEMARNEAKPAPVRLSPEILGEEDIGMLVSLLNAYEALKTHSPKAAYDPSFCKAAARAEYLIGDSNG